MKRRGKDGEREVLLLGAGGNDLSFEEIVARCEERMSELVAQACLWRTNDHARQWKLGDYRILIFETTAALNAELYVQFWSEPVEPVEWEVCSGHANPSALPFVGEEAQRTLRALGFEIGGRVENFRKSVTIANIGDVQAVARETLRIFVEVFGYRGRTPLVARITANTRAERAWAHRSLSPEDVQKIFWHTGHRAVRADGFDVPVLNVERDEKKYSAVLYGRVNEQNLYECVDLRLLLGRARRSDMARLMDVNARYRSVKAFVDEQGEAWLVQTVSTMGGITEESFATLVEQFEHVLDDRRITHLMDVLKREASQQKRGLLDGNVKHEGNDVVH